MAVALDAGGLVAKRLGEDLGGSLRFVDHCGDAVESTNRVLGWHGAAGPGLDAAGRGRSDEFDDHTIRIGDAQHGLAEARREPLHAVFLEALLPIAHGGRGNCESRCADLTRAPDALTGMRPWEEGHDRSRRSGGITEVEVIAAGIVEVDGLLHKPQTEQPRIEVEIALRIAGNRCDVMK